MYCDVNYLLNACISSRSNKIGRMALLIEDFPRRHHQVNEFAKLLCLLAEYGAKATFLVDWCNIRQCGHVASVSEIMRLLKLNDHEIAIRFRIEAREPYDLQQHAVEALHFFQRVYGITVVSAKVSSCLPRPRGALETLGVKIVDGVRYQHVVKDSAYILTDVEEFLDDIRGVTCVPVSELVGATTH